jgi:hypothetical protein
LHGKRKAEHDVRVVEDADHAITPDPFRDDGAREGWIEAKPITPAYSAASRTRTGPDLSMTGKSIKSRTLIPAFARRFE